MQLVVADLATNGNVRTDVGDVTELAKDIDRRGLIQPIVVRRGKGDEWVVVDGHRRLAAIQSLDGKYIEATEYTLIENDADRIATQVAANVQRRGLTPYEQMRATLDLKGAGLTQKEVAAELHMSTKEVSKAQKIARAIGDEAEAANQLSIAGLTDLAEQTNYDTETTGVALGYVVNENESVWYATQRARSNVGVKRWFDEHQELSEWLASLDIEIGSKPEGYDWLMVNATPEYGDTETGEPSTIDVALDLHRKEPCHNAHFTQTYQGITHLVESCADPKRHVAKGGSNLEVPGLAKTLRKPGSGDPYKEQQKEERKAKQLRKEETVAWLSEDAPAINSSDMAPYLEAAWRKLIVNDLAMQYCKVMELDKVEVQGHYSAVETLCAHIEGKYKAPASRLAYASLFLHGYQYIVPYATSVKELGL